MSYIATRLLLLTEAAANGVAGPLPVVESNLRESTVEGYPGDEGLLDQFRSGNRLVVHAMEDLGPEHLG